MHIGSVRSALLAACWFLNSQIIFKIHFLHIVHMSDHGSIDSIVDFEPIPEIPARIRRGLRLRHMQTNELRHYPEGVLPQTWAYILTQPDWVVVDPGVGA